MNVQWLMLCYQPIWLLFFLSINREMKVTESRRYYKQIRYSTTHCPDIYTSTSVIIHNTEDICSLTKI